MSGTYTDLEVWQCAMDFVVEVYRHTNSFPRHETYGLANQLRRAAVSVPSNIAEGKGRRSEKELIQFLSQARGSRCEAETQIMLAKRLGYLEERGTESMLKQASRVGQLLNGLMRAFREHPAA